MSSREQEALAWRERLKTDSTPHTQAAFEQWLAADPDNAREFEQQGKLDALMREAGLRGVEPKQRRVEGLARRPWLPLAIGAGAVAITGLAVLVARPLVAPRDAARPLTADATALYRTRHLADGSIAVLSQGAALGARPAGSDRGTSLLSGSARFFVMHDPAHPFVVRADAVSVVARGTVFDIDMSDTKARVTLIEGKIDVRRDRPKAGAPVVVSLVPGQQLGDAAGKGAPAPAAAHPRIALIEAERLPLGDVVRIVNAQEGGTRLELAAPSLAARVVTGRFDIRDVRALARQLATALDLGFAARGDTVLITPR
jgi:transmembrane sensor